LGFKDIAMVHLSSKYFQNFCIGITLIVISLMTLQAGVTGKIAGQVIDEETMEPLPFVNVMVEGTYMGAATDMDGFYSILNIPPGRYTISISIIGYKAMTYKDVPVSIDLTTELNFSVPKSAIEMDEIIVSASRKPLVVRDLTASTAVIRSEDIDLLPVVDIESIMELQAGVVGGHVRGGRSGEIMYAIDGVPIADPYDGAVAVDINKNSVQELQFVSGAFNAEYGKALSGYVNIVTKDADNRIRFGLTNYIGDHISNHTEIFRAIDRINPLSIRNTEAYFSAPIIKDKIYFHTDVRSFTNDGWMHGKYVFNPWDITINNGPATPIDSRYTFQSTGDSSYVPMNWRKKYYGHVKLTFKPFKNFKINFNSIIDHLDYQDYNHMFAYNPKGYVKRFSRGNTNSLTFTHMLSEATFYQAIVSSFSKTYKHYVYKDHQDSRYTDYRLFQQQPMEMPTFQTGGTENQHFKRQTDSYLFKFDLTSQINKTHQLKAGIEATKYELKFKDINLLQEQGLPNPSQSMNPYVNMIVANPDDPDENLAIDLYTRKPIEFSTYIQDKIELNNLIINIGVRYDYFNSNGFVLTDVSDPDIYRPRKLENTNKSISERREYWYRDVSPKSSISPRLGVAFPITATGVVHFSYGYFFQVPNFELLYQNPEFKFGSGTGNIGLAGNADLKPEETINGEVGIKQGITDDIALEVTAYFRDIRNLAGTRADEIMIWGGSSYYHQLVNSDFGLVKGVILTFDKRISNNWGAAIDYTYQVAKGNASDPAATRNQIISGERPEIQLVRLDFDQTHTVNVNFSYISALHYGFSILGKYGSGFPYTPSQSMNISELLTNSERKPGYFNVDLNIFKDFTFKNYDIRLFTRIYNLFDRKNQMWVYNDSGTADFTLDEFLRTQQNLPELVNTISEFYRNPTAYSEPRRLEAGISINWKK